MLISVCARDRPKRGCKSIYATILEIDLIAYGNWKIT